MFEKEVSVVIPTRSLSDLRDSLITFLNNTNAIEFVVIVTASPPSKEDMLKQFQDEHDNTLKVIQSQVKHAGFQRNLGVRYLQRELGFFGDILFIDDDMNPISFDLDVFIQDSRNLGERVLTGACINLEIHRPGKMNAVNRLLDMARVWLRLYPSGPGLVAASGFQSPCCVDASKIRSKTTVRVEWLPTGFLFVSRWVIENRDILFLVNNNGSYLEDLNFSYAARRENKASCYLMLNYICETPFSEKSSFYFGVEEVVNRWIFVSQFTELSKFKCIIAMILRMQVSFFSGLFRLDYRMISRALGNIASLLFFLRRK